MAERAGVAQAVTARQAARVAEKARPLAIIWPDRAKEGWPHA
jgi:hypothetical protein